MTNAFPLPERVDGKFPGYTPIGCYTLAYYTEKGEILCADCASTAGDGEPGNAEYCVEMCDVYWEGPTQNCENCDAEIESSYGDPNAEGQEEK